MLKTKIDTLTEMLKKNYEPFCSMVLVSVIPTITNAEKEIISLEMVFHIGEGKFTNHYTFNIDLEYYRIRTMHQKLVNDSENQIIPIDYIDNFDVDFIFTRVRNVLTDLEQQIKEFTKEL